MKYSIDRIKTIFSKELKDTLRDRRTIIAMILGPVIVIPLVTLVPFLIGTPSADNPIILGVVNPDEAPTLMMIFEEKPMINVSIYDNEETLKTLVNESDMEVGIVFSEGFEQELNTSKNATIYLYYDSNNMRSEIGVSAIREIILGYRDSVVREYLMQEFELTEEDVNATLEPINMNSVDLNPRADNPVAFMLILMLPMFLVIWGVTGGMNATIDLTTGEKERKTMESLLTSPASRTEIVIGKFFAILAVVMITLTVMIFLMFGGAMASSSVLQSQVEGVSSGLDINPFVFLIMLALVAIFAVFIISIELIICSYARNFKEASTYISPLTMIIIFPAIFSMYMSFNELFYFALPVLNVIACMKGILAGNIGLLEIGITFFSSAIYGAIAIFIAAKMFMTEKVLFRS